MYSPAICFYTPCPPMLTHSLLLWALLSPSLSAAFCSRPHPEPLSLFPIPPWGALTCEG